MSLFCTHLLNLHCEKAELCMVWWQPRGGIDSGSSLERLSGNLGTTESGNLDAQSAQWASPRTSRRPWDFKSIQSMALWLEDGKARRLDSAIHLK